MAFLGVLIAAPWLGLIPAALFAGLYKMSRRRSAAATAFVWVLYAAYEYGMKRRWLCTGECNIRVDLLLIYPLLAIISVTAATVAIVAIGRHRTGTA